VTSVPGYAGSALNRLPLLHLLRRHHLLSSTLPVVASRCLSGLNHHLLAPTMQHPCHDDQQPSVGGDPGEVGDLAAAGPRLILLSFGGLMWPNALP
jgi:hypothetical protein